MEEAREETAAAVLYRGVGRVYTREVGRRHEQIYVNVELLKRDMESTLVKKAGYGLLWMSD